VKKKSKKTHYTDKKLLAEIGTRVRELRKQQGLTQSELAFKCNDAHYTQIQKIEYGTANLTISYLSLLAHALDVTIFELLPQ
jgi:transcriptional regulator with XRE-family HTH domain